MPPKGYVNDHMAATLQNWIKAENDKRHSMAVKYIEENVDLIDNDLQKFMDDCPASCQLDVYEMLLKAGIDMNDYVTHGLLKQWEIYLHDANPQSLQCYTIDYKEELNNHITQQITKLEKMWKINSLVEEA